MSDEAIRSLLRRKTTPELHQQIRELWIAHSLAEDRRDIPGLLATLTPDCVYRLVQTGHEWHGHEGAERFYRGLLTAFPDIKFQLTDIVIGPQGVCEEANVTGTFAADWLDYQATGRSIAFRVVIFFPWDPDARKFSGEKVYLDSFEFLRA